ncbi:MAG: PTS sugar transporter subunit IIB [Microbacterium sp.]
MKILCVCGFGMGSSLILKMSVEKAMKELGIAAEVEHEAAGMIGGSTADIIVASPDFEEELASHENTVFVRNIVSVPEVKSALEAYLDSHGLR